MPIYTSEQLAKVGTGETVYSAETGRVYTFSDDKTYMFYGESEDITDVIKSIVNNVVNEKITSIYPVGSIYLSTTDTNPGTYLGGTWESYGQGRTLVGAGEGTDTNGTRQSFLAETTGGEYTHTLGIAEMPSHNHSYYMDVFRKRRKQIWNECYRKCHWRMDGLGTGKHQ